MVSNSSSPQRKSTRPASGKQPQRRSVTGQSRTQRPPSVSPRTATSGSGGSGRGSGGSGRGSGGSGRGPGRNPKRGKKATPAWKIWLRRIGVGALAAGLVTATLGIIALVIRYNGLDVPEPAEFALIESSTVYYDDVTTVMGRLGEADRDVIDFDTLPAHVGYAFVAAEDRSFYSNPGVDAVGTARALVKTVVFGKKQGASTITQQYVERYYSGKTVTDIVGKIDEALLALKIDSQQDKEEILGNYMNTVYFGRGAYGIEAAAREYFDKHAADLTVSEAALLAGILPAPSAWDPRFSPEQAEFRWGYVLDGMVEIGQLSATDRARLTFPETVEYANADTYGGTQGYLLRAALNEVEARTGITQTDIETRGYRVVTTFNVAAQAAVEAGVATMPEGAAPNMRVAALTMDADTGAVTAMYGGADYLEIQRNAVTQDIAQAGSTFKPFTLVAALESGIGLGSVYDGDHLKRVEGFANPVRNFASASFGDIDLIRATAYSVNTVYTQLNVEVGPDRTRDVAVRAGIPEDTLGLENNASNVLGTASPHALDLASAYATFAAGGLSTEPFMVLRVVDAAGEVVYEPEVIRTRVIEANVMADATYAMQQVVNFTSGSGHPAAELGRPIAGKTGTANENRSAWFVGFTPQVVGVVGMYQVGPDGEAEEITPFGGFSQITGGSVPVRIWTEMMRPILEGLPVEPFPSRANVGIDNTPEPSPSPTPTPTPSPSPSPTPEPTPEPEPTILPEPTIGPLPTVAPDVDIVAP